MTICKGTSELNNAIINQCNELGVSLVSWKGRNDTEFKLNTTMTDQGLCCSIRPSNTSGPRAGLDQGLKLIVNPGLNQEGIWVALHHADDVPLMGVRGTFISKGKEANIKVKLDRMENIAENFCINEKKESSLKNGFGSRFSLSNCILDNVMEEIKTTCQCQSLKDCNQNQDKWNCARDQFRDPYRNYSSPIQCMEQCKDFNYKVEGLNSMDLKQELKLCQNWFTIALKKQCLNNQSLIENGFANLCTQVQSVNCLNENPNYDNKDILKSFVQDKMISLNVFIEDYYIATHYVYFTTSLKNLIDGILLNLVVFFGFSIMSFPELLYYAFCSRGGGCICKPILHNC